MSFCSPDILFTEETLRYDDRLRVCFSEPAGAVRYELGVEKGSKYLENTLQAEVDQTSNDKFCVISKNVMDVGAYVDLWVLVTAFNANGAIVASGEDTWVDICKYILNFLCFLVATMVTNVLYNIFAVVQDKPTYYDLLEFTSSFSSLCDPDSPC